MASGQTTPSAVASPEPAATTTATPEAAAREHRRRGSLRPTAKTNRAEAGTPRSDQGEQNCQKRDERTIRLVYLGGILVSLSFNVGGARGCSDGT